MSQRLDLLLSAGSFTFQDIIELHIEKERARIHLSESNKTGNMSLLYESLGMMGKLNGALKRAYKYTSTGNLVFPTPKFEIDFETTINGIPCGVHIDEYYPHVPPTFDDPGEEEVVTFTITDRHGYEADWLHKMACIDEIDYIDARAIEVAREMRQDFDY